MFLSLFLSILGSFWFMMPTNMAFIAVALAAISPPLPQTVTSKLPIRWAACLLSPLLAIGLLISTVVLFNYAKTMDNLERCLLTTSASCPQSIPDDPRGLEQGSAQLLKTYTRALFESSEVDKPDWQDRTKQFLMLKDKLRNNEPERSILQIIALQNYYGNALHNPAYALLLQIRYPRKPNNGKN